MTRGFLFDPNRCTGCEACRLACAIENGRPVADSWRRILTFNERSHRDAPRFHLSLACHHCAEAPCMAACPALAYRRDPPTGAVSLESERCIGCGYCGWVCPFDAPVRERAEGVMSKCTLCRPLVAAGSDPACSALCPTGALEFGELDGGPGSPSIRGFPETSAAPSIRFTPLRRGTSAPEATARSEGEHSLVTSAAAESDSGARITLGTEWPLLVFSVLAPLLVALWSASRVRPLPVHPFAFLAVAAAAIAVSSAHLGRKERAWRALLNVRRSWLSREVLFYGLFVVLAALSMFSGGAVSGWAAVLAGFAALYSMDRLYEALPCRGPARPHSAEVALTGLYLAGLLMGSPLLAVLAGTIKVSLYALRKLHPRWRKGPARPWIGLLRIGFGIALPGILLLLAPESGWPWAAVCAVAGETVDRVEFYAELEAPTRRRPIEFDLSRLLASAGRGA